jgi:hypothetical protein
VLAAMAFWFYSYRKYKPLFLFCKYFVPFFFTDLQQCIFRFARNFTNLFKSYKFLKDLFKFVRFLPAGHTNITPSDVIQSEEKCRFIFLLQCKIIICNITKTFLQFSKKSLHLSRITNT